MNKLIPILFLLIIFLSCNSTKVVNKPNKDDFFQIEIIQDDKLIEEKNGIIFLEKKPFKYKITLFNTDHIYVSNSWEKYYYDYPNEENIFKCDDGLYFKDCRFVAVKTPNEDKFNSDKDIIVGDGDYQAVWFYDKTIDWHRFDKGVTIENGVIHASVTVENIFDADKRDEMIVSQNEITYKIEDIDKDIFVVFATDLYEKGMEHPKELQREKFILKFK